MKFLFNVSIGVCFLVAAPLEIAGSLGGLSTTKHITGTPTMKKPTGSLRDRIADAYRKSKLPGECLPSEVDEFVQMEIDRAQVRFSHTARIPR